MSLIEATKYARIDEIIRLVEKGADVNQQDMYNCTVLHHSFNHRKELTNQLIKYFIHHGANINIVNNDYHTALHLAVKYNNLEAVSFLVNNGIDIHLEDKWGYAALHMACGSGRLEIAKFLLDLCYDNKFHKERSLNLACWGGHYDIVKLLIKNGTRVNHYNLNCKSALHRAVIQNNYLIVNLLIEEKADVNHTDEHGRTPLYYAKDYAIAKILISNKADTSKFQNNEMIVDILKIIKIEEIRKQLNRTYNLSINDDIISLKIVEVIMEHIDKGIDINSSIINQFI